MRWLALCAALIWPFGLSAHEFWIDPHDFVLKPDSRLVADLRVGENLKGSAYSYLSRNFVRFDLVMGKDTLPVPGRDGDRPALNMAVAQTGLAVIVHQTSDNRLTYKDMQKFENFVRHKDLSGVLEAHAARGLPEVGFREVYSRYAKSLIAIGSGEGTDRAMGLETEIVALANPYTDPMQDGMPIRVLYQGEPRADAQVELFERAPDGTVAVSLHRTDARGELRLPVQPGHVYLADAVVMRPVTPEADKDPVWESLWASLTFKVPG